MSLDFKDAGSAALDNLEALAQMRDTWQANVQQMAQLIQKRGWEVSDEPWPPVGLSAEQLDALETTLGEPLPAQLRWLLSWASEWQFGWDAGDEALSDELEECTGGQLQAGGRLQWSAQQLEEDNLRGQLLGWLEHHQELIEAFGWNEDDKEGEVPLAEGYLAFWQNHFPFAVMPNGDLLTIDTRNPDPQSQPVRYFFHELEGDDMTGLHLAPNLFSFISRWTALGCVGMEWFEWQPFWRDDNYGQDPNAGLDLQGETARLWLDWLTQTAR